MTTAVTIIAALRCWMVAPASDHELKPQGSPTPRKSRPMRLLMGVRITMSRPMVEDGDREERLADHRPDRDAFRGPAEQSGRTDTAKHGEREHEAEIDRKPRDHVGTEQHDRRMGEAEHLHRLVDDHEAQGQQGVDGGQRQSRDGCLEERRHAYIPSMRSEKRSTRTFLFSFWVAVSSPSS